jgi:hypothetical protein
MREAVAARNTLDVDVDQWRLIESAGGDSLSDDDVPLPDIPLSDVSLPGARPESSVGEELTSPLVAEEAIVVVFRFGLGSYLACFLCSNVFISGIDYYTRYEVFGSFMVHCIYGLCTGFIFIGFSSFIVLWDIGNAAMSQLLACKEPPCDGVEAQ